jgi:hypothetical protein
MTHPKTHPAKATLTPSEEFIQRYSRVEREADVLGRVIAVRRLKPSQSAKVIGFTLDLEGEVEMRVLDEKTGEEKTITIQRRFQMTIAAAVCEIDSIPIPFPRNRGELDAIYDRLDNEGVEAAMIAYSRLFPAKADDEEAVDSTDDAAKK